MDVIADSIFAYLSNVSAVTDIVGLRMYPVFNPQNTIYPSLMWILIEENPVHLMGTDAALAQNLYRFISYAKTSDEADALALQVTTALQDFSGQMGGTDGITVQRIFMEGESELYSDDDRVYKVQQDYRIWFT